MTRDFKQATNKFEKSKKLDYPLIPGFLGFNVNGVDTVEVPTRPGYVFVRLRGSTDEVIQAFNDVVSPVNNLPVLVTRDDIDYTRYRVFSRDTGMYVNWGSPTPYLPRHGDTHSFSGEGTDGGDVVWVYSRQITPLLVVPSGTTAAGNVYIEPGVYYQNNQWRYAGGTGTTNLLTSLPAAGKAKMILIYLDENGNPGNSMGVEFNDNITGSSAIIPYIPTVGSNYYIPLAGIRIVSDTTGIDWANITDLRPWIVGSGFIPTGSVSSTLQVYDNNVFVNAASKISFDTNLTVIATGTTAFVSAASGGSTNLNEIIFVPNDGSDSISYPKSDAGLVQAIKDNTTNLGVIHIPNGYYTLNTGTVSTNLSYIGESFDNVIIEVNVTGDQIYAFSTGNYSVDVENIQFIIYSDVDFEANPGTPTHYGFYSIGSARNVLVYMEHTRADKVTGSGHKVQACTIVPQNYSDNDEPYSTTENVTAYLNGSCTYNQVSEYDALVIGVQGPTDLIYSETCYGYCIADGSNAYGLVFSGGGDITSVVGEYRKLSKLFNSRGNAISSTVEGNVNAYGVRLAGKVEANNCYAYAKANFSDTYYTWANSEAIGFESINGGVFRLLNCIADVELISDAAHGTIPYVCEYRFALNESSTTYKYFSLMQNCRGVSKGSSNTTILSRDHVRINSYITTGRIQIFDSVLNSEDEYGEIVHLGNVNYVSGTEVVVLNCVINNIVSSYTVKSDVITIAREGLLVYDDNQFVTTGTSIHFNDNLDVIATGSSAWVNSRGLTIYDDATIKATGTTTLVFGSGISVAITGSFVFINVP